VQKVSLDALAQEHLATARRLPAARSAVTVFGGHEHALRQTVLALTAGAELAEHDNPGEATVFVLSGRVELHADGDSWQARRGDLLIIPDARHTLRALEDATLLLSAVPRGHVR
jgi:quercetin dioxygenase-like cupin family protein